MRQPLTEMGRVAAEMLVRLIDGSLLRSRRTEPGRRADSAGVPKVETTTPKKVPIQR